MAKPKVQIHQARALVLYYSLQRYTRSETIVLCDAHRPSFYNLHPDACGYGEWRPVEECAHCKAAA